MPLKDPSSMCETFLVLSGRSQAAPFTFNLNARLDMGAYDYITVSFAIGFNAVSDLAFKLQHSDSQSGGVVEDIPGGTFTIASGIDDVMQTKQLRPRALKRYLDMELDGQTGTTAQVCIVVTGYRHEGASILAFGTVKPMVGMS